MIRRFIARVLGRNRSRSRKPVVLPFEVHGIDRAHISKGGLLVCDRLQEAGYKAYVVGGAVRDLLIDKDPKDFDVATDATPEQIKAVIRRSRIIGRRFRLVHVPSGDEIVEVSTFRGGENSSERAVDAAGRITSDNVFGNQEEDARRRDFTINALFYDPNTREIIDYHGGVADIKAKRIRMIGDPAERYREDPIRMVRATRFAGKLGFTIDQATQAPIQDLAPLLQNVPAARMFDEMLKLLLCGHAWDCITQLRQEGLHHGFLPMLDVILEQPMGERFVRRALENTDARVRADKSVSVGFLCAALLWHEVLQAWKDFQEQGERPHPALFAAMDKVLDIQEKQLAIPRRFGTTMKDIWAMQPRFEQRNGQRPFRLLESPGFRAGYDFLLLRCDSGEADPELGVWWTRFQEGNPESRQGQLMSEEGGAGPRKKRRRRRARGPRDGAVADGVTGVAAGPDEA